MEKRKKNLERIQNSKLWDSWDILAWTHRLYYDGEKLIEQAVGDENIYLRIEYESRLNAITAVINGDNDPQFFKKATGVTIEDFKKIHLQRVYWYIEEELNKFYPEQELTLIDSKEKLSPIQRKLSFDEEYDILWVKGEGYDFSNAPCARSFTGLFFPRGKPSDKGIHRDDIWTDVYVGEREKIDYSSCDTSSKKDQVYNTKSFINRKTKKIGVPFFTVKNSIFSINKNLF